MNFYCAFAFSLVDGTEDRTWKIYLTLCLVQANPHNYDAWFDYLRLMESDGEPNAVREIYERAVASIPLLSEKRHWRRYIYLWINYALYEELEAKVTSFSHEPRVCNYS